jgi:tetratricopeptide (TPR) repeat protein
LRGEKLEELIDQCIKISNDMKCIDWVTTKLLQIFKDEEKENVYFKKILELDPNADKFLYTTEFFTSLINQKDIDDVFSFIKKLPATIAPPALVLKFAVEKGNIDFALEICLDIMHDIISAVNILFNEKNFEKVIEYLTKYITEQEDEKRKYPLQLISWVLSHSKEGTPFPRVSALLNHDSKKLDYFDNIYQYILKHGQPITLDTFMNVLIMIVTCEKLGYKHKLFTLATNIFIENNVKLMGSTLKVFLTSSFSEEFAEPDQREKLLLILLERGYLDKMTDTLMTICESFNFRTARGQIMLKGKKYEAAIKEMLEDPTADVYEFINSMLAKEPECKPTIKKAIETDATLLLIKDLMKFFELIYNHFNEMLLVVPRLLSDPKIVNTYIRQILTDPRTSSTEIPSDLSDQYIQFICNYYPNDVLPFLRSRKDVVLTDYLKICKEKNILDALVYIDEETMNLGALNDDIINLIDEVCMMYVDGAISESIGISKLNFIIDILNKIVTKNPNDKTTEQILLSSIKAIAVPLFAVGNLKEEEKNERAPLLRNTLHKIVTITTNIIKFDKILKFLIDELAELNFGEARETLTSVITDYTYDVDSDISLAQLFKEDEAHAYENYVITNLQGFKYNQITCCSCQKRLDIDGALPVRFFKCGHTFHNNAPCLTRDICPVCFAEERLDEVKEDKADDTKHLDIIIKRKLSRFEVNISQELVVNSMIFDDTEGEVVMDPPTATELPLD